jgi:tetratricopeptide (TPR) repeat protein
METYYSLEALGEARGDDSLRLAGISAQGTTYLMGKGDNENSLKRSEEALALARQLGDRWTEARSLWSLLLAFTWIDTQQALEYGESGLAIARELASLPEASNEDLELLALILMDLTIPLIGSGQVKVAGEHSSESHQIFEQVGNLPMASTAAQRLGLTYKAEGKFEQAEEAYDRSTEIDQSIGNDGGLIGSSLGLFDIYPQVGNFSSFLSRMEMIKPILIREKRVPVELSELYPIVAYFQLGALEQALELADAVLQFKERSIPIWPDYFLCYLALTYIQIGDLDSGRKMLAALSTDLDMGNYLIPLVPLVPQIKTELAAAEGNLNKALQLVDEFLYKIRQDGMVSLIPEKLLLEAKILSKLDRHDEAYDVLIEAHSLATEQNARSVLWQICSRLAEMEVSRGNLTEAQSLKEQAREVIDYIAEYAGRDDLCTSFLAISQVQTILSITGEKHDQP